MMRSTIAKRLGRLPLVLAVLVVACTATPTEVPAGPAAAEPEATAAPDPQATETEPAPDEPVDVVAVDGRSIDDSRDPFVPVRPASTTAEAPVDPAAPTVPGAPTSPVAQPGEDPPPAPAAPTSPPEDCSGDVAACIDNLTLREVGEDEDGPAVFQISTTLYEVRVGEVFAGGLQLIALYGDCATVAYEGGFLEICAVADEPGLK